MASEFLRDQLANGPKLVSELKEAAEQAGINWSAVKRTKTAIGAVDRQAKQFGNRTTRELKQPADPTPGATSLFEDEMLPD